MITFHFLLSTSHSVPTGLHILKISESEISITQKKKMFKIKPNKQAPYLFYCILAEDLVNAQPRVFSRQVMKEPDD